MNGVSEQRPQWDDDELMARTAAGEEAAFRLLVDRWQRDVLAFLIHMTGSRDDAEDLAQETFVRVFRQAGNYRAEGRFRSWLLRIAGNLARSRHRRRRLLKWLPLDTEKHDVASSPVRVEGSPPLVAHSEAELDVVVLNHPCRHKCQPKISRACL